MASRCQRRSVRNVKANTRITQNRLAYKAYISNLNTTSRSPIHSLHEKLPSPGNFTSVLLPVSLFKTSVLSYTKKDLGPGLYPTLGQKQWEWSTRGMETTGKKCKLPRACGWRPLVQLPLGLPLEADLEGRVTSFCDSPCWVYLCVDVWVLPLAHIRK